MNQTGYQSNGPKCFGTSKRSTQVFLCQHHLWILGMMISLGQAPIILVALIVLHLLNGNSAQVPNVIPSSRNFLDPTLPHSSTTPTPTQFWQPTLNTLSQNPKYKTRPATKKMKILGLIMIQIAILTRISSPAIVSGIFKKGTTVLRFLHLILMTLITRIKIRGCLISMGFFYVGRRIIFIRRIGHCLMEIGGITQVWESMS